MTQSTDSLPLRSSPPQEGTTTGVSIADVAGAAHSLGRTVTHVLKVWPEYGDALADGSKSFEFRLDDRGFAVGDLLHLREWAPSPDDLDFQRERIGEKTERYTGRSWHRRITYIARGGVIPAGYCVLAMVPAPPDDVDPRFVHSPTCTATHFDGSGVEAPDCLACNVAARRIAEARLSERPAQGAAAPVTENATRYGVAEVEAMLRRHMGMYDWSKRETVAINDFILTVREGIAEELATGREQR